MPHLPMQPGANTRLICRPLQLPLVHLPVHRKIQPFSDWPLQNLLCATGTAECVKTRFPQNKYSPRNLATRFFASYYSARYIITRDFLVFTRSDGSRGTSPQALLPPISHPDSICGLTCRLKSAVSRIVPESEPVFAPRHGPGVCSRSLPGWRIFDNMSGKNSPGKHG